MLLGRLAEIKYLDDYYSRSGSQIIVVYGQKNIGKTALLKEFISDKPSDYYLARSCSQKEQLYQWSREIRLPENNSGSYEEIFSSLTSSGFLKKVLVIDEFQNLIKANPDFLRKASLYFKLHADTPVLMILCSSSVGWVENSMIRKLGETAFALSGLLKIKEIHFLDIQMIYAGFSQQQCLEAYAVLGGVPGLWEHFEEAVSIKENIIRHIIPPSSVLAGEAERILSAQLRETNVYNTILTCLASGMHKLNDLYRHTGFSRAKISVYLKNLMDLEITEKSNEGTGTYRIKNQYINFYYTYIYPNMSFLQLYSPEQFFTAFIAKSFNEYVASCWRNISYTNGTNNHIL